MPELLSLPLFLTCYYCPVTAETVRHSDPHVRMILFVLGEIRCFLSYRKSRHELACSIERKIRSATHGLLHLQYTTSVCRISSLGI